MEALFIHVEQYKAFSVLFRLNRMDSLRAVINDLKVFCYGGLSTLPMCIAGTMLLLGLFTTNYGMIFFLGGYLIGVPIIVFFVNKLLDVIGVSPLKKSRVCSLVVPFTAPYSEKGQAYSEAYEDDVLPYWIPMISFFSGYMMSNAGSLYTLQFSDSSANQSNVANRKTQALISFLTIFVFFIFILYFRSTMSCESLLQIVLSAIIFLGFGIGYFFLINTYGETRLTDIFGIANRVLMPSELNNGPVACAPVPS